MDQPQPTDVELVAQVAAGDTEAMEELYIRYSRPVFSMGYGILRDRGSAEDVTQEVFLSLWTKAAAFDPALGVFKHWFLHLAHNRIIDELRRRQRATRHSSGHVPEDAALGLEAPDDTAGMAMISVMSDDAKDALTALPAEQRAAVVMAYLQGRTQQEIAAETGVPLGTVKTRLRLGIMKLRQVLSPAPGQEM